MWPKELNRADQARSPTQKLIAKEMGGTSAAANLGVTVTGDSDIAEASFVSRPHAWRSLKTDKDDWFTRHNREVCKELALERNREIYRELVESTGLLSWTE